ncbi:PhzF family phenazine biosynthesis protein [Flexivirga alba]|uniref:PhzF family phenazine biosynthesis protein n=1 Tax=Flexivirga alba TaxID=702742 RepID=A0ABW2ACF5_9MICO
MALSNLLRYSAFTASSGGGNRAGVVLDASALTPSEMQSIAAEVGYSESAFVTSEIQQNEPISIRFFAPEGEVAFCGHATIATAAAIAENIAPGAYELSTQVGSVLINADLSKSGPRGSLDSPATGSVPLSPGRLDELLRVLRWSPEVLHPAYRPAIGTAGNHHPVLVVRDVECLATLDYDFAGLQRMCRQHEWITVQLVTPDGPGVWRARDPFPYGGVVEDPATGSAAAAFTGYLRSLGQLAEGDSFTIRQGIEMGHPSELEVLALSDRARVSGAVVRLPA